MQHNEIESSKVSIQTSALVLSGGGALGAAHLGALQGLYAQGKRFDYIVGVSAGALAGALLACGHNPESAWQLVRSTKLLSLFYDFSKGLGLISGRKIHLLLERIFEGRSFADLSIPLLVGVTDFGNGEFVEIASGKLSDALRASISVPVVFQPFYHPILQRWIVDGGITNNFPVDIAMREYKGSQIIAIDVATSLKDENDFARSSWRMRKHLSDAAVRTLRIVLKQQQKHLRLDHRVKVIRPELFDFSAIDAFKLEQIWQKGLESVQAS